MFGVPNEGNLHKQKLIGLTINIAPNNNTTVIKRRKVNLEGETPNILKGDRKINKENIHASRSTA